MPFVVHSPFDGEPVKVRDEDVGRALRDKQNRIFYALPKSGGEGYYGAATRQGGLKDEQRYEQMMQKTVKSAENVPAQVAVAHDATGRKRTAVRGKLVKLVLLLILLAVACYVCRHYWDQVRQMIGADAAGRGPDQAALVLVSTAANCPGAGFAAE